MSEYNLNSPQVGMSMSPPSLLKEGQFCLLVNGNIQTVDGNFAMITNDGSNLLGTRFKDGFKVIGTNIVPSLSTTFFFLYNPITLESEIGFIFDTSSPDKPDATSEQCCENQIVESTPLEQTTQYPLSQYYTFVNAACLNFDIDHPVTSWVKIDDCNVRIYFNDFKNPPRYINYKDFQKINISNCPLIETDQLDCDKIQIFPETCYPVVDVVDVIPGGQNIAGVYQFAICYSDVRANKLTDYFYVTNPTPLFDQPITINTNYPVYKSFKLEITNLNTDFRYFNLAVVKTINNVSSVYLVETFEVNSPRFEYIYTGVDKNIQQDLSLDEILAKRPYYNKAKITTESNGYLFMATLEEDRILNLQPVVSEIPLYWQTVEMNDGDYANPIIAQNYVGYLGDEVYPFGISFTKTNGKQTNVFAFVNREATPYDLDIIDNLDVISYSSCSTETPSGRWQVYNTASISQEPLICITEAQGTPVEITDEIQCFSDQILVQVSTFNALTGQLSFNCNPNPNPFPTFWQLPSTPCEIPQESDIPASFNFYNNCYPSLTVINPNTPSNFPGLCDCTTLAQSYPTVDGFIPIGTTEPFDFCTTSPNSSIQIITDEYVVEKPVFNNTADANRVPKPEKYPYEPSPCSSEQEQRDNWESQQTNVNFANAKIITQVQQSTCQTGVEQWGVFYSSNPTPTLDFYYSFTATNINGAADILFSNNSPGRTIEVFKADQTQLVNNNPLLPDYINTSSNINGVNIVLRNLTVGATYYIKVSANNTLIPPVDSICKQASFKLCLVTPVATGVEYAYVPAVGRIIQTCKITYKGFPNNSCEPRPNKHGEFAYWESTETYPCNVEVWGDLAGKPIRHFKFPDNSVIPFFEEKGSYVNGISLKSNKIYPKGIKVNITDIKQAIAKAVELGLITAEEANQICGYRIYRGNRRGNQSIIAKGLLYDVWEYTDNIYDTGNKILFPNFPFNDNSSNQFIKNKRIKKFSQIDDQDFLKHPFESQNFKNNKYTFDAPNLSFNNPGLGTEIKLEGEQTGTSIASFPDLRNNTKYQYIGAAIISASIGFASVEAAFEALSVMAQATLTLDLTIFGSGTTIPLGLILAAVGENILAPMRIYSHYAEWYDIIKKFAPFRNYAFYYTGVGKYTNIISGNATPDNTRRTIANAQYVKPGILNINTTKGSTRFNNFKRDSSVFIELEQNSFFLKTQQTDNSRPTPNQISCENNPSHKGNLASYYASLKNPLVNQYGQIDNIEWIDTGYNGRIDWNNPNQDTSCDTIFGGDTYITRFTKKRKVPMFLEDRVIPSSATQVSPINQDIQLSLLPNIGYPRYWMDYPTALDYTATAAALFGDVAVQSKNRVDFNFICKSSDGQAWKDAGLATAIIGGFAGAAFGIISLPIAIGVAVSKVKQDLGNDLFLKGKYVHSFYGISSFLVESDYNLDYRHGENIKEKNFYPNVGDIIEWTQEFFIPMSEDNYYFYNNDYSKQNTLNPNFVLNNDFKQTKEDCKTSFPNRLIYSLQDNDQNDRFDGNLIFLANNYYEFPKSGGKLLIVKGIENGKVLAIQENRALIFNSFISLETNVATATVGANTLFNQQAPTQFIQTDLGFGGSQTPAIVSTEFGHFWVDNKRGQVLVKTDSVQNIVKPEEEWWFKENLPFHILEDFPDFDVTNNFKYIGMSITYDQRFKRVIFTKRDVELKPQYKGLVTYDGTFFHYGDDFFTVEDSTYFCNKSWTISYSPILKSFISFHTFTPNYYIPNQAYFSSGVNYSFDKDPNEYGLWHHNLTSKSYQVYYGKLEPFIFEFTIGSKYQNKMLESVRYTADFYRFQDNISSGIITDKTYNQAVIYNQVQTSGLLELVPKQKNDRRQYLSYPKQNIDSRSILVEYVERGWQFNNYYDVYAENSGQPIMSYQCDNISYKEINPLSISYKTQFLKKKLVSDYFVLRLINNKYSNYAINHRFSITKTQNINQ